jgi:putative chitinase
MSINIENLKGHIPDNVYPQIMDAVVDFELNTPLRLAHFLGQCSHESMGFKVTQENLNYSSDALKRVFGKYFPDDLADDYARQPEKIANRVYANRMGNGDEDSGDGWSYHGRGYIQLTGKDNYQSFGDTLDSSIDIIGNPDLVSTDYPLLSAGWFFHTNGLQKIADIGATDDVVTKITKRINGGINGLAERILLFNKFYKLLS